MKSKILEMSIEDSKEFIKEIKSHTYENSTSVIFILTYDIEGNIMRFKVENGGEKAYD